MRPFLLPYLLPRLCHHDHQLLPSQDCLMGQLVPINSHPLRRGKEEGYLFYLLFWWKQRERERETEGWRGGGVMGAQARPFCCRGRRRIKSTLANCLLQELLPAVLWVISISMYLLLSWFTFALLSCFIWCFSCSSFHLHYFTMASIIWWSAPTKKQTRNI